MKKAIAVCIVLLICLNAFPQCTPHAATGTPGLSPVPASVPCIERGVFFDFTLYFENFTSFSCTGFSANVLSGSVLNLNNLPCGITWQANKSSYAPGETGCIRIYGTTNDSIGQYPLTVGMTFDMNILGSNYTVGGTLQNLLAQLQTYGCSAPSVNIDYYSRVIQPGTTCPAIGTMSNKNSSGFTCVTLDVSISGNNALCTGSSTTLTATATHNAGTVSYSWSPGGATTPSITVSPSGTTTYSVTATDISTSATSSSTVTISPRPNAAFSTSAFGANASINTSTTGATSYSWDFGDGQTSTVASPNVHTYSANGTYTITLIASNFCGSDTAQHTVTITQASGPAVTITGNTSICPGGSTVLTATTGNTTGTIFYSWSPGVANASTYSVSPASTTTYSVTITAGNGTATASATVTVSPKPNAAFSATPSGMAATFSNLSTGATTYMWYFGDGQTSTSQNPPAHTYPATGSYIVTLIVYNSGCSDTANNSVIITGTSAPSVTISGNTSVCPGISTTLTANPSNTTGSVTYSWSPGGGITQTKTVSPTSNTTYSVTITASNGTATASATVTVSLNQRPNAAFTASASGASATVNNTTTGASSYSWSFGDGQTSTVQYPSAHTYSSNGNYTITLIATNSCGTDTATQQVTITVPAGVAVTISGNTTICAGSSTTLTANVTNATGTVNYLWSPGNSTAQTKTVSPTSNTTYSVTITASNGSATASATVIVNQRPAAAFTASASGASASVNNTTAGASSYSWSFGDGQTSTVQNPSAHTYSSNGNYTITLIATNSCGTDTATQQVTISGASGPSVSISGNTSICNGESTTLTANASNATGTVTYAWSPGGGNAQTKTVNPASTTTYSVTITAQNGSATTSAAVNVTQKPSASFTASVSGAVATISNTTIGASSYSWNFGDGQTSTVQNPLPHTYASNGIFTITMIATESCNSSTSTKDTATQSVNIIGVGIGSVPANPVRLKVYPNPFNSATTIEVENLSGSIDLALYTITGLKVYERKGISEHQLILQKESLAKGVYFIEVRNERIMAREKVVIY